MVSVAKTKTLQAHKQSWCTVEDKRATSNIAIISNHLRCILVYACSGVIVFFLLRTIKRYLKCMIYDNKKNSIQFNLLYSGGILCKYYNNFPKTRSHYAIICLFICFFRLRFFEWTEKKNVIRYLKEHRISRGRNVFVCLCQSFWKKFLLFTYTMITNVVACGFEIFTQKFILWS